MDAGFFGSVATVLFFLLFVGIVWWAFHRDNKQKYEDAAQLPFQEDARDDHGAGKAPN
jgi:cytochrome c oxidase cbb3-type subunit 4